MPETPSEARPSAPYLEYALAKPGAWADEPWEGDLVAKVGQKIFLFTGADGIGVKCGRTRAEADEWVAEYPGEATASAYIGRYGWNALTVGGAIPHEVLLEAIDASYDEVVSKLPKSQRPSTD